MQPRDPVTELHDTKLYRYLQSLDEDYAKKITIFVESISPLMASISTYFPFYTRHDVHHGYQVVKRIEQSVLPVCFEVSQTEAFNAPEAFLLIAAAYAHDLGMAVFPGESQGLLSSLGLQASQGWETHEELQSFLRRNHSIRGGEYIGKHAEDIGVPRNLVTALDLLMKAHNFSIPELEQALSHPFAAGQKEINLAQLAIIVCTADAIEFSDTRVVEGVIDSLVVDATPSARTSYMENMKHVCTGDSLAVSEDGRIIVGGSFDEAEVLALAHRTFDQMEEWIRGYSDIDQRCRYRRLKVGGEPFHRNLVFTGGNFHRLGVRLNKRSVIDLIASNAIWRMNQGIALRELLQNAVEACRYRQFHSSLSDAYQPEIRVFFDRKQHSVRISDNGCGMSERTVLNNFLTVGSSRSKEKSYASAHYSPIARFGIGFWSVFTIADNVDVSTAAFEEYRGRPEDAKRAKGFAFNVQLGELQDFTVFSALERRCGTDIVLQLKPGVVIDDVYTSTRSQLVCSMVPMVLVLDDSEEILGSNLPDVTDNDLFGVRRDAAKASGVKAFRYQGCTGKAAMSFGLAYRIENGRASFTSGPGMAMFEVIDGMKLPRASVCGFTIAMPTFPRCIDLSRVGMGIVNATVPDGLEFSIDRMNLNSNDAQTRFSEDIRQIFHDGYRAFLKETNSYCPEAIYTLQYESEMSGGNVYDTYSGNELAVAMASFPDLISTKLLPIKRGWSFEEAESNAKYVDLNELSTMDGMVMSLQATRDPHGERRRYLDLESPTVLATAYQIIQANMPQLPGLCFYLAPASRASSRLFDNAPGAPVNIVRIPGNIDLCFLMIRLSSVVYQGDAVDVVPTIRGPWSGSVYWRAFQDPDNKSYLFMGRHRVLIRPGTRLERHFRELVDAKKFATIAAEVHLLQEDAAGHKSAQLAPYL